MAATFTDVLNAGSITLNGNGAEIQVRVVEIEDRGKKVRKLDIRKFVTTNNYTGPTSQGISLDSIEAGKELAAILTKHEKKIAAALKG